VVQLTGRSGVLDVDAAMTVHPFERSVARFADSVRKRHPKTVFCTPADARATLRTGVGVRALAARGR